MKLVSLFKGFWFMCNEFLTRRKHSIHSHSISLSHFLNMVKFTFYYLKRFRRNWFLLYIYCFKKQRTVIIWNPCSSLGEIETLQFGGSSHLTIPVLFVLELQLVKMLILKKILLVHFSFVFFLCSSSKEESSENIFYSVWTSGIGHADQ